jgi:hypothetical protein
MLESSVKGRKKKHIQFSFMFFSESKQHQQRQEQASRIYARVHDRCVAFSYVAGSVNLTRTKSCKPIFPRICLTGVGNTGRAVLASIGSGFSTA